MLCCVVVLRYELSLNKNTKNSMLQVPSASVCVCDKERESVWSMCGVVCVESVVHRSVTYVAYNHGFTLSLFVSNGHRFQDERLNYTV